MSQSDLVIENAGGASFRADVQGAIQAVGTNQAGGTAPGTPYPNQWWADTANNRLKRRNSANNAWIDCGPLEGPTDLSEVTDKTAARANLGLTIGTHVAAYDAAKGSNGNGNRTVSTSAPSGGADGDLWMVVAA